VAALRGVVFAAGFVFLVVTVLRAFAGFFVALAFAFDFAPGVRFPDERAAFARADFAFAMRAR
jgi:hypothetical protein